VEGAANPVAAGIARFKDPGPEGVKARKAAQDALALKDHEFNAQGVELNQRYSSTAVLPDPDSGAEEWKADKELYLQATTRPGAKLPHAWLVNSKGRRISTLDVIGKGKFTLVTGLSGEAWAQAASALNVEFLKVVQTGTRDHQDPYCEWQRAREVEEAGAILVRPDGYVAWREIGAIHDVPSAREKLQSALSAVLGID
jgi:2,4-dichlorophenol 6-monooxygenase